MEVIFPYYFISNGYQSKITWSETNIRVLFYEKYSSGDHSKGGVQKGC